jgi:hypothetical protein
MKLKLDMENPSDRETLRRRTHQPLPFIETPAKAQLAGSVETQSSVYLTTLSAICIVGVPIMAA